MVLIFWGAAGLESTWQKAEHCMVEDVQHTDMEICKACENNATLQVREHELFPPEVLFQSHYKAYTYTGICILVNYSTFVSLVKI